MTDETNDSRAGYETLIKDARLQMQAARSQYHRAKLSNRPVPHSVRHELAAAALNYYDVLWEHVDDNQAVRAAWEDSDLGLIKELSEQTTMVKMEAAGDTTATQVEEQNALVAADPDRIVELTKQLDYFAKELGFGAEATEGRDKGRIGGEERYE